MSGIKVARQDLKAGHLYVELYPESGNAYLIYVLPDNQHIWVKTSRAVGDISSASLSTSDKSSMALMDTEYYTPTHEQIAVFDEFAKKKYPDVYKPLKQLDNTFKWF